MGGGACLAKSVREGAREEAEASEGMIMRVILGQSLRFERFQAARWAGNSMTSRDWRTGIIRS